MEVFALSGLINAIIALTISILVFARNRKSPANRTFALFAFLVAFWSFGYWRWLLAQSAESALFWIKLFTLPSVLIPASYFHWIILLLEANHKRYFKRLLYLLCSLSVILFILLFPTKLLIQGIGPRLFFPYWPIPGTLYLPFIGLYSAVVVYSLILLFKSSRHISDEARRKQQLFVFWGTLIGFGGAATNFFLWYGVPIPPYGNFLVSLGLFLWGYAAAKYHLFNVKLIAAELLTFAIWVAVFIEMLTADTGKERLWESGLFVLVVILGSLLIKSFLKLEAANKRLRQLDKLKSEFLSFASHQVKAPMTIIKNYASLISEDGYGKVPEKVKETAIRIGQVTDRTIRLVTNFLDLRKIEEGKMEYQFSQVDIVKLVKNIVEELKLMAQQKKLDLTFEPPASEIKIRADEQKLRQVIQNLVENAVKYTEKGFVKVELRKDKDSVLITVTDSGLGISKELLPNLFQRFSRDSNTAKEIRGTGLGLYIAKEIIKAHDGKIWAESEGEGKGSRFCVELQK